MQPAPIKTAVVGTGLSATVFHLPFLLALPSVFDVQGVVSRSGRVPESISSLAERARIGRPLKIYRSLDELLSPKDETEIELVVICTPNNTHFDYAKAALESGRHVILEKPFVPSSKEASELIELAKKHDRVLAVYQNRRWDSDFLTLQKLLPKFGNLSEFKTSFDRWKPNTKGEHETRGKWKETGQWGDGLVFDLGSHLIDQVLVLFGVPEKVFGNVQNARGQGPASLIDSFTSHFYYSPSSSKPIPLTVTISGSSLSLLPNSEQPRFQVRGTRASWSKKSVDPQEEQLGAGMDPQDEQFAIDLTQDGGEFYTLTDSDEASVVQRQTIHLEKGDYMAWFKNVGGAIQSNDASKLIVKPEQARDTIRMIELIHQSSDEGRTLKT